MAKLKRPGASTGHGTAKRTPLELADVITRDKLQRHNKRRARHPERYRDLSEGGAMEGKDETVDQEPAGEAAADAAAAEGDSTGGEAGGEASAVTGDTTE